MATRYLTTAQLLAMFPGNPLLGVAKVTTQPVPTDALDSYINLAEDLADVYLSSAYELPLLSVPPIVQQTVGDITRWYIYSSVPNGQAQPAVQERYDAAIALLSKISSGKLMLGVPNQDTTVAESTILPLYSPPPRRFNGGFFNGY
ncbi:phage protein Gp36 family protein [Burkholderia pseudomallei]